MTQLTVYSAENPAEILFRTSDFEVIVREAKALGAGVERWKASHPFAEDAGQDEILSAYKAEIDRLKAERGYISADVISVRPGNPNWPALRQKFLGEHVHDEDEVRFFVKGSGAFYLHIGDKVYQIIGEADDLLTVPQGTRHWFDGGPEGDFTCIRVFKRPEGWIAHFTGSDISQSVPTYEAAA